MLIKTRFCPSPTGFLHLGNLRTALFNALFAKNQKGSFLLRIEDTDQERSKTKFTTALEKDLKWLGLDWDEGPNVEGKLGPYLQSKRTHIYDNFYKTLQKSKLAYPCFCSEEKLILERKIQLSSGRPPRYSGTCKQLNDELIQQKIKAGEPYTLRFKVPPHEIIQFTDHVKGQQTFKTDDIGDFIIRRTSGTAPFLFCNAIDDALMKVTHVLRGEDHLTNTPRQMLILKALDLPIPEYAHISLIVGHDGTPLSKRHGSKSVDDMRIEGFLPIAILNYLGRLGHHYSAHEKLMSLEMLAQEFSLSSLGKSAAKFDFKQLQHWQKIAIESLSTEKIWQWVGEKIKQQVPEAHHEKFIEAIRPNIAFPFEAEAWANCFYQDFNYSQESIEILQQVEASFFEEAIQAINQHGLDYPTLTSTLKAKTSRKGKALFQPLRVALTNQTSGPEMHHILDLLGTEKAKERFLKAKIL
jgi:glutamyl-tRNA synthetase